MLMCALAALLLLISTTQAQQISTGGSWDGAFDTSDSFFIGTIEAAQRPNITRSVAILINEGDFALRVNLTDVPVGDGSPNRVAIRSYDLSWNSSSSSDSSMNTKLGAEKLCVAYSFWTFPPATTNAYRSSGDGSCIPAFGEACVQALRTVGYNTSSQYEEGCAIAALPSACEDVFPFGRNEPKRIGDSYNMNHLDRIKNGGLSPLPLFYNTTSTTASTYQSANVEGYELERDRLHFLLLGVGDGVETTPVCIRLAENQITADSAYQDWGQNPSNEGTGMRLKVGTLLVWLLEAGMIMWTL